VNLFVGSLFASGVEDEVIDAKWLKEAEGLQPYVVGLEVLLQDALNTSDGESTFHFFESFADAACQILLEMGADKLAETYLKGDPPLAEKIIGVVGKDVFNEAHKDAVLLAFSSTITATSRSIVNTFLPHGKE